MCAHRFLLLLAAASLGFGSSRIEVDVKPDVAWTDTGLDVMPGDIVTFDATGSLDYQGAAATPDGRARGWKDLLNQLPLNSSGRGALIGRWSKSEAARPFLIGSHSELTAPIGGHLFLGINQMESAPGVGSYHVLIDCQPAPEAAPAPTAVPRFTQGMLNRIAARVTDEAGDPGDRVNFVVIGSEARLLEALKAAGWVAVDKTRKEAVLHGLIASLSKEAYVTLPMSTLDLFGRPQDYGFAQGDPLKVVASRHHFRIWKCPFTADGETVWAGAGTHDIGFDRDSRTNGITHKIDPATDGERDYIADSLQQTGMVWKEEYMMPSHPVKDGRTATGGEFTSDGRTAIVYLKPAN